MSVRYSSDTPGGKPFGVPVPLNLDPGENTEPGTVFGVGVAVPELGREVDMLVVDSNSLDKVGFDLRYGKDAREEAGEWWRCRGSIIEASRSARYVGGFGVAS
jgi:hypothetical protein